MNAIGAFENEKMKGEADLQRNGFGRINEKTDLQENGKEEITDSWKDDQLTNSTNISVEIIAENPHSLLYNVNERTPIYLTFFFAIQQTLLSFSGSIAISFLVAEAACADKDDEIKTMLLSSILFMNGVSTFVCVLFGVRLPLFQGTCADYVVPLVAIMVLDPGKCARQKNFLMASYGKNETMINDTLASNGTESAFFEREVILQNLQVFEGCLMLAGVVHTLIGATGLVGFLLKFVGPITVVPTILLSAIFLTRATTNFAKVFWGTSSLTAGTAVILALYLAKRRAPIPVWSRQKGFHILWYPLHQVFALLIAIILGWMVSGILTTAGVFSDDPNAPDYNARTDARADVISTFPWFYFPYPGQFGPPSFNVGVFIAFLIATITSILDSIGDYYACQRMCNVPPPPSHAVNRGIATEGLCTIIAGAVGCGVANTTTGGNIGAIGVTKVASRDVFVGVALINIFLGIIGKFGAIFVTIPYPVLGGSMIILFGMLFGIVLSNLQVVSLASTRNLAVIGISMLVGIMIPRWVEIWPEEIDTGSADFDNALRIMFANPMLSGGIMACFLDNTVPGTPEERGITAWKNMGKETEEDKDNNYVLGVEVYDPILPKNILNSRFLKYLPFCPNKSQKRQGDVGAGNEKVELNSGIVSP